METKRTFGEISCKFSEVFKSYCGGKTKPEPLAEAIKKYGVPDRIVLDNGHEFKEYDS